jgi:hypothetical protein
MICKQCGAYITHLQGDGQAYCDWCALKRIRACPEIDKETGDWNGMER